jgi:catechol 2,3-dioxygenase-like lactoylglutathione lyase family enzyme
MEPRINFVTLVVRDLAASRRFYVDGLGWPVEFEAAGDVIMIRVGDEIVLSLWDESSAAAEIGPVGREGGVAPFTLACTVASREEVDHVVGEAVSAGAVIVNEPTDRDWGGYTGYIADPDGFRWEIVWDPGPVGEVVP